MHKTVVKTLWKGTTVAINEFEIKKGILSGGLRIIYKNEFMDISWQDLSAIDIQSRGRPMKDKFGSNKIYHLIDFEWKPKGSNKQNNLFNPSTLFCAIEHQLYKHIRF